ncbi:MAG: hypothetical protein QOC92_103 [Acidimicrobiaceae bacterium]
MLGELVEATDCWLVPMVGRTVTQCRLDYAFSLVVAGDVDDSYYVTIEQPFTLRMPGGGGEMVFEPEGDPVRMAPALRVLRQDVERVVAFKDGRLELTFADGSILRVPVGEDYEPWNIVGPAGFRIVSLPGGELAIWSPESDDAGPA